MATCLVATPRCWSTWRGELFARLENAALGAWRPWLDYPLAIDGRGGLNAWLSLDGEKIGKVLADVSLRAVSVKFDDSLPQLDLSRLDGRLGAELRREDSRSARAD